MTSQPVTAPSILSSSPSFDLSAFLFYPYGAPAPQLWPRFSPSSSPAAVAATLSSFLRSSGLTTALVSSPHHAVTILLDRPDEKNEMGRRYDARQSKVVHENTEGMAPGTGNSQESGMERRMEGGRDSYVMLMLGIHPDQEMAESSYRKQSSERKSALAFLHACLSSLRPSSLARVEGFVRSLERQVLESGEKNWTAVVEEVVEYVVRVCPENRRETLKREAARQRARHCSLANALFQRFLHATQLTLSDITYRAPPPGNGGRARLSLLMWEASLHQSTPPPLFLLPALTKLLAEGGREGGREKVVSLFTDTFWQALLLNGYHPESNLKERVTPALFAFAASSLGERGATSVLAHFSPTRPFSLYLTGDAGVGKSAFVARFPPALATAVEACFDPQIQVQYVKQNLNKTCRDLEREMTLRPNNNDLSVMSIIQGRRQSFAHAHPGLVVVGLEEVPPPIAKGTAGASEEDANVMSQVSALSLLVRRFSGRTGEDASSAQPRASPHLSRQAQRQYQGRDGISTHTEVLCIFTSNYPLLPSARILLSPLPLFQHLVHVPMEGLKGRGENVGRGQKFARDYLGELLARRLARPRETVEVEEVQGLGGCETGARVEAGLEGEGDIRGMVRQLRTLAFLTANAWKKEERGEKDGKTRTIRVSVREEGVGKVREEAESLVNVTVDGNVILRFRRARARRLPFLEEGGGVLQAFRKSSRLEQDTVQEYRQLRQAQQRQHQQQEVKCGGQNVSDKEVTIRNLFPCPFQGRFLDDRVESVVQAFKAERMDRNKEIRLVGKLISDAGGVGGFGGNGKKRKEGVLDEEEDEVSEEEDILEESEELGHIIEYYFEGVLVPAVLIIQHRKRSTSTTSAVLPSSLARCLMRALTTACPSQTSSRLPWIPLPLGPIDVEYYPIVKSAYDGPGAPNLRDDIKRAVSLPLSSLSTLAGTSIFPAVDKRKGESHLSETENNVVASRKDSTSHSGAEQASLKFGTMSAQPSTSVPLSSPRVAIHLQARSFQAQLKIRELLEDTPSMVAYSTAKSALRKEGLIFIVEVGEALSPEIGSRASLILYEDV